MINGITNWIIRLADRIARRKVEHIREVYQTEDDPEGYLRMERELRRENILEGIALMVLLVMGITAVKVWFAYEGFTIEW